MRATVKRIAERLLLHAGPAHVARVLHRGRSLVLAYHNIVPDGEAPFGDRSLHLPRHQFARHLDLLEATHDIVSLPELIHRPPQNGKPRAAITFDDAYRGAVTEGVAELSARGLPATIFVAPAFVGGKSFWWDALADPEHGAVREDIRRRGLEVYCGQDARIREWAETQSMALRSPPEHAVAATERELRDACVRPEISLASHTWSHPNLARLSGEEVEVELRESLEWLRARFACVIPWLTYPYGLCSRRAQQVAADVGYEAALLVAGGWVPRPVSARHALPRLNVPASMSTDGLALRLAGLSLR